jgi:hypothetical protein
VKALTGSNNGRPYFEGVTVRITDIPPFKHGAAMAVPGIGIFTGPQSGNDLDVLKHEFGHILQYRKWGSRVFWTWVAPSSLRFAHYANNNLSYSNLDYMSNWTEWSANYLSYRYFNGDFNTALYPIKPVNSGRNIVQYPVFVKGVEAFYKGWLGFE